MGKRIEKVSYEGKIWAVIIRAGQGNKGIQFYTPDDWSLQVGTHRHGAGTIIKAHMHEPVKVERTASLQEVLYIEKGKVKVAFYRDDGTKIQTKTLHRGDIILLMEGGHGFKFLAATAMIEIKQGPYLVESRRRL